MSTWIDLPPPWATHVILSAVPAMRRHRNPCSSPTPPAALSDVNAIWSDARDGDACYAWARQTLGVLGNDTLGVYSVEVRPGFEETERETQAAFGANP